MNSRTAEKLVNGNIEVTIPIYIRRESNLVTLDRLPETPKTEWQRLTPLQRRLVLGFHLLDKCEQNPSKSSVAIAKEESMDRSLFYKTLSLVNLAPDIVEEIMSDPPTFDFSVKKTGGRVGSIHLLVWGTQVRSLVWEDPTYRGATEPRHHKY